MRGFWAILFISIFTSFSQAQTYVLRGHVNDETGKPLAGATVYLHETYQGTISNDSGYFSLSGIKKGTYHLHVTYVGYHGYTQDIRVHDSLQFLAITLHASDLELHEAVVEENALKLDKSDYSVNVLVLGEESLKKNQGPTLSNAIEQVPGVNSINMGVGVSKPMIRGLSGNRIVVAENGIKQEGQQWGGDHGLELDPFNAERIEIIKGPASLLYGSDAMGGVIHIKQPLIPGHGKHEGKMNAIYKSVNHTMGSSLSARGNQNGWVYRLRGTWMDYGDYHVPADSFVYNRYVLPVYGEKLKNTAGKELHFAAQLGLHKAWGYTRVSISNFHQKIGVFSGAIGIPREYALTDDGNTRNIALPNQDINHFKVVANSNFQFGRNWLETDLGFQDNLRSENSAPHAHGQTASASEKAHELRLRTLTLNSRFHQDNKKGGLTYGFSAQYQTHRFSGYEFLLPNFESIQTGLFLFQKYRANPLLIFTGGLRLDYGRTHIQRHVQGVFKDGLQVGEMLRVEENTREFFNWTAAIGLSKTFNHAFNFKANLGKSFRIPTPQELSVNGVHHGSFRHERGDANLRPEQGYQADLSLNFEEKSWYISLSPYLNYFQNYIYLRPTAMFSPLPEAGQIFQYEQTGALFAGGEFSVEYHPIKVIHLECGLEYVYTQNLEQQLPLPFIPPFQIKSAIEWELTKKTNRFSEAYIRLSWIRASAQTRTDRNERETPAYNLFHFGLGSEFFLSKKYAIDLSINIRNVFDTAYFNHLSRWRYLNLPEPGRNVNVQLIIPIF